MIMKHRVAHREDYHRILLEQARDLGVEIRLGAEVKDVDFEQTKVVLVDGEIVSGDVIVGADGEYL